VELPIIQKRTCGDCTMCCKTMGVIELKKDPGVWCPHCDKGVGCKVYEDRPPTCQEFECHWLREEGIPDVLRPDRSKVVLASTQDGGAIVAFVDPRYPDAAEKGLMGGLVRKMVEAGLAVIISRGQEPRKILYNGSKVDSRVKAMLDKYKEVVKD